MQNFPADNTAVFQRDLRAERKPHGIRAFPADCFQISGGVVSFPVIQTGFAVIALKRDLPAAVGDDPFRCTVGILYKQLQQEGLPGCGDLVFILVCKTPDRPSARDNGDKGIGAGELFRHIIKLVLQILFVAGEAGGEITVSDFFAIQLQLVNTDGRGCDVRPPDRLFNGKALAEGHGNGRLFFAEAVILIRYPRCLPGKLQPSGSEGSRCGGFLSVVIPDLYPHRIFRKGLQGKTL